MTSYDALPGGELVEPGLADLAAGRETVEALLVAGATTRLRAAGIAVPEHPYGTVAHARMYDLLVPEYSRGAHGRYNALLQRLLEFLVAQEALQRARRD